MTRIAVLFDGTWSDEDSGTNIARLDRRVARRPGEQEVHYVPGVGTSRWERLRGGVLGRGVDDRIREGYAFVARHHRSADDRIFLLGYSRGAFTARSLAGMIAKCGIVTDDGPDTAALFAHYRDRTAPGLRELLAGEAPARTEVERALVRSSRLVRIRFVGVFDTVGSLGVPGAAGALSARRHAFHDTNLSGLVDHGRHAVALDERRASFAPTLWTAVPVPVPGPGPSTTVEQRWFVGSHSNVGGGDLASGDNRLSALAREWLADEARAAGLEVGAEPVPADAVRGAIEPSDREGLFRVLGALLPSQRPRPRAVRRTSLGETLDPSVLLRWEADAEYRSPRRDVDPGLRAWVRSLGAGAVTPAGRAPRAGGR
jgi:uncharacterized protein (DUF2235 family)